MKVRVSTQGISRNRARANGDYDTTELGELTPKALLALLEDVAALDIPDDADFEGDFCPPQVLVDRPDGQLSLTWNGEDFEDAERGETYTAAEAAALASSDDLAPGRGSTRRKSRSDDDEDDEGDFDDDDDDDEDDDFDDDFDGIDEDVDYDSGDSADWSE